LLVMVIVGGYETFVSRLRLEVRKDNAAAIGLYERLDFHRFGEKRGFYEDGADAWRYEKRLAHGK